MPQVFGQQSLMDRNFRTNRHYLMNWCTQQNIGLTDLITNIQDADIHNHLHNDIILSVDDNAFDTFAQLIPTDTFSLLEIKTIIRFVEFI